MQSVFGHSIKFDTMVLYIIEVIFVFASVYGILVWGMSPDPAHDHWRLGLLAAMLALSSGVVLCASGMYQPDLMAHTRRLALGSLVAILLLLVAAWLCLRVVGPEGLSLASFGQAAALALAAGLGAVAARLGHALAARSGLGQRRLLIVSDPEAPPPPPEESVSPDAMPGTLEILLPGANAARLRELLTPGWLRAYNIWAVVAPGLTGDADLRRHCNQNGVRFLTPDEFHECRLTRVAFERLPQDWLATATSTRRNWIADIIRRGFDIMVALSILLFTLPVMLMAALIIRLDSPGPVFYRQERTGRHGRGFMLYKFRSMVVDAERGGAPRWATPGDPRVTRFGRFMRLTRIDELPQLLNVLRGDMAMVGPRPERPAFVDQLSAAIPHYQDRHCVKPGITGWAQVNYPYGASIEDARMKLAYDLYYVRRRSLFLDLLILIATVRVVLFQEGAR
jgi:lipopolysaccharide/colanic/teichoic acid biosynthesis glycosyltransferase